MRVGIAACSRDRCVTCRGTATRCAALEAFSFAQTKTTEGPLVQANEEGVVVRTNWVGGFIAYFSDQQSHIFTIETSITGPGKSEKSVEFFHEDVVSLATGGDQRGRRLVLTVQDGSRYLAPISDVTGTDPEVAAARELIRGRRS